MYRPPDTPAQLLARADAALTSQQAASTQVMPPPDGGGTIWPNRFYSSLSPGSVRGWSHVVPVARSRGPDCRRAHSREALRATRRLSERSSHRFGSNATLQRARLSGELAPRAHPGSSRLPAARPLARYLLFTGMPFLFNSYSRAW